jgi:anti-anti-sigma factor
MRLSLSRTRTGIRVVIAGELDLAGASRLDLVLARLEKSPRPVMVDLRRVSFADTHGLAPLLDSVQRRRCDARPALILLGASSVVRRVLESLGNDPDALELAAAD